MKLWLSRQHNGLYMLSYHKPIKAKVEGRDFEDFYILPGEPVGMRNFCDLVLELVHLEKPLRRGDSIEIELDGRVC